MRVLIGVPNETNHPSKASVPTVPFNFVNVKHSMLTIIPLRISPPSVMHGSMGGEIARDESDEKIAG